MAKRTIFGGGSGSGLGTFNELTPESFGAKRDGIAIGGVDIDEDSSTLTSTDAEFSAADVGKVIAVYGAGITGNGSVLVSTIDSVTSPTEVELADVAAQTVTNSRAVYGTDDAAAIEDAIDEIVSRGLENETFYGELRFSAGIYMITRAPLNGTPYFGNAQIRLPIIPEAGTKFELSLRGASGAAATFAHWNQTIPQRSGTVLYCTLVGGISHGTYGPPAVIGGPTVASGSAEYTQFSNMKLVVEGLTLVVQRNPSVTGLHVGRVAQLHIKSFGVLADMTPSEMNAAPPTNDLGLGMRVPQVGNNHFVRVDDYAVEGVYYGLTIADHFTASRVVCVYTNTAMFVAAGGANEHGASILNLGVEASSTILEASLSSGGRFPIDIAQCNTEIASGTNFKDTNNALVGYIGFTNNNAAAPTVSGCKNLTLIDLNRRPGAIASGDTPAVPATGTPLKNPFYRNCQVLITGGTVTQIAIDGENTGLTSGWFPLATGKEITITHSSAPSWKWWAE